VRARLASGNRDKLAELRQALPGWELELLDADEFPPEVGESYYENARGKAEFARAAAPADDWALGEDSGIEVEALGGAPGIRSARWAGGDHVGRVLAALADVPPGERAARYVCELVALAPDGRQLRGTGVLKGRIAAEPRGEEGFGFDPVFVPAGEDSTVAELGDAWKQQHSHRALAAAALLKRVT
jgi:XTP/dITP diphosphohydrolase